MKTPVSFTTNFVDYSKLCISFVLRIIWEWECLLLLPLWSVWVCGTLCDRRKGFAYEFSNGRLKGVTQQVPSEVYMGPHVHCQGLWVRAEDVVGHVAVAVRLGKSVSSILAFLFGSSQLVALRKDIAVEGVHQRVQNGGRQLYYTSYKTNTIWIQR